MTKRPAQHQIASLAVAAVRREWNLQGHAVDEIKEDYGEDLMVQICLNGNLDPARIWVQVKGTSRDCTKGALPRIRVKSKQVLRWARSADLVIAVLWSVTNDRGWFTLPQDQFDHVDLSSKSEVNLPLQFTRDCQFDQESVESLAWSARIQHANKAAIYARSGIDEGVEMELDKSVQFHKGVLAALIFDFGEVVGVIDRNGGFAKGFPQLVVDHLCELSPDDLEYATQTALVLGIFSSIEKNCAGNGSPLPIIKEMCGVLYPLLFTDEMLRMLDSARIPRNSDE
ncbi:DUF4365 domain-containing protein [Streptomyces sp. NPDC058293]|uniref:DUF4365 domain-containing protein n=1 Tax=Streptomyces sp. NPDC058293 TaxID=3346429 RepID=UPI0036F036F8